jgi:hypothetical protein
MRTVGRIIIDAIASATSLPAQTRLAGEVREIVARFPGPGPAHRRDGEEEATSPARAVAR